MMRGRRALLQPVEEELAEQKRRQVAGGVATIRREFDTPIAAQLFPTGLGGGKGCFRSV
jgi:hypothetical protein